MGAGGQRGPADGARGWRLRKKGGVNDANHALRDGTFRPVGREAPMAGAPVHRTRSSATAAPPSIATPHLVSAYGQSVTTEVSLPQPRVTSISRRNKRGEARRRGRLRGISAVAGWVRKAPSSGLRQPSPPWGEGRHTNIAARWPSPLGGEGARRADEGALMSRRRFGAR